MSNKYTPVSSSSSITRSGSLPGKTASASGAVGDIDSQGWWSSEEARLFSKWRSSYESYDSGFSDPYFDYFYTGQDIKVSIDGLSGEKDRLPIYSFGYNIQQQKTPIYGFWDYTYSGMLRGTRIITGAFSIVSIKPLLLTSAIAKAADIRAKTIESESNKALFQIRGLDSDERRIAQYWQKNIDSNLDIGQQHLFSVHPPFNFVIKYGLQEVSNTSMTSIVRSEDVRDSYKNNNALMTDINERLVKNPIPNIETKILLENVELTSKSIEFNVDGDPLIETYTFIARDERLLTKTKNSITPVTPNYENDSDQDWQSEVIAIF